MITAQSETKEYLQEDEFSRLTCGRKYIEVATP
jgi:hypothetical protein